MLAGFLPFAEDTRSKKTSRGEETHFISSLELLRSQNLLRFADFSVSTEREPVTWKLGIDGKTFPGPLSSLHFLGPSFLQSFNLKLLWVHFHWEYRRTMRTSQTERGSGHCYLRLSVELNRFCSRISAKFFNIGDK